MFCSGNLERLGCMFMLRHAVLHDRSQSPALGHKHMGQTLLREGWSKVSFGMRRTLARSKIPMDFPLTRAPLVPWNSGVGGWVGGCGGESSLRGIGFHPSRCFCFPEVSKHDSWCTCKSRLALNTDVHILVRDKACNL